MSAFVNPAERHLRRHVPRGYANVESYRPWLRDDFIFRCVYCLFREQSGCVKAAFALDHFCAVCVFPELQGSCDNLLYACAAWNQSQGAARLPDPTQVLMDGAVRVHDDGRIEATTPGARRIIRILVLDGREETETRLLWLGIITLAQRADSALYHRLMGFPESLPDLKRLRLTGGNERPEGVPVCYFAQRRNGTLVTTY
jgi:hypothetical protein